MTAEEKLAEAKYNLKVLENTPVWTPEIHHALNNFIISSVSVFYHLLEDYNRKYDLKLDYVEKKRFKEAVKDQNKLQALDFIRWYVDQFNKIEQEYDFLIERRRLTVHKEITTPKSFRFVRDPSGKLLGGLMCFEERPHDDMKDVCKDYLNRIEKFVYDTFKKYPKWQ